MIKKNGFLGLFLILVFIFPLSSTVVIQGANDHTPRYLHISWQNDPATTMTATWMTNDPTDSIVQFGLDNTYGNEAVDDEGIYHAVEMTGLTPDTKYHYRVGNGADWTKDFSFTTGTAGNHIQFLDVGDCQNRPDDGKMMHDTMSRLPADVITFTGDLCNTPGTTQEWYNWFSSYSPLVRNVPLMNILGNHERNFSIYYDLFSLPGKEEYYSFNLGPVHFVGLHTLWNGAPNNLPEQAAWLTNDLENHKEYNWTIVLMHIPPFSSFPRYLYGEYDLINETFVPIFEQYDVDLVFTGHEHAYERLQKNGVTYVISGGGGSRIVELEPVPINESVIFELTFNFLYVDVYENKLSVAAYRPDYTLIDQHVVNKVDKADLSFVTLPITYDEIWTETVEMEIPIIVKNTGTTDIITATQAEYTTDAGTFPVEVPPLAVGENYTFNVDLSAPSLGTFSIEVDIDITDIIDEVIEENNNLVLTYNALEKPTTSETGFLANGIWGVIGILSTILVVAVVSRRKRIR